MRAFLTLLLIFGVFPPVHAQGRVPVREAGTYDARDAHEGVTIVADAYLANQAEKIKAAFGKYDPHLRHVLPVYIVVFNPTKDAIQLGALKVNLESGDGKKYTRLEALQVSQRFTGLKLPRNLEGAAKMKSPVASIVDQEFVVKMVPPGDTVGGFLYFDELPDADAGWSLYLSGLKWAATAKELLYFELRKI